MISLLASIGRIGERRITSSSPLASSAAAAGNKLVWRQFSAAAAVSTEQVQASDSAPVATTTTSATDSMSLEKPDNSKFPNAPIRKFFEDQIVPMKQDQTPGRIPFGRPWFASELRIKSFEDLHKLHFALLIEKNKLYNEKIRSRKQNMIFPSPERLRNVRMSMARLQTVLHERARESKDLKEMQAMNEMESGQVPEMPPRTAAQEKWFKVHEMMKKEKHHNPSPIRASGGQKTREKMVKAKVFEEETMTYISEIEKARQKVVDEVNDPVNEFTSKTEVGTPIEKPRWRNLNIDAQARLHEKQAMSKVQKLVKARLQSEAMKKSIKARSSSEKEEMDDAPKWSDRPELAKLLFLRREKAMKGVRRGSKGRAREDAK